MSVLKNDPIHQDHEYYQYLLNRVRNILRDKFEVYDLQFMLRRDYDPPEDSLVGFIKETDSKQFYRLVREVLEEKQSSY